MALNFTTNGQSTFFSCGLQFSDDARFSLGGGEGGSKNFLEGELLLYIYGVYTGCMNYTDKLLEVIPDVKTRRKFL